MIRIHIFVTFYLLFAVPAPGQNLSSRWDELIYVREWAARVTAKEYAAVFPDYFYGQIYEAKHQPGTFALPSRLLWDLLDATCEEIARNGFRKILIINGHGGNPN